ncbi:MAG: phosphoribosylanthranilate isomerase [Chitinophagales bacterium]
MIHPNHDSGNKVKEYNRTSMNIKVCGITQLKQLEHLDAIDIDFAGLNFYKESPRYVVGKISSEDVRDGDFDIKKVGVFVNESLEKIMKTVEEYGLDIVQLHGEETPEFCRRLSEEIEVIKTFRVNNDTKSIEELIAKYDDACDYYLFDTGGYSSPLGGGWEGALGGTGVQFDWKLLNDSRIEKPFFLAGGIGLPDVVKVKMFDHPDFFAVDINSKFEISPGEKDLDLVKMFAQVLRN